MPTAQFGLMWGVTLLLAALSGCQVVPKNHLDAAEAQNRTLLEQKDALLAENANLRTHSRRLEEQVKQAEEELAALNDRADLEHRQLSDYEREREQLQKRLGGLAPGGSDVPANRAAQPTVGTERWK